MAAADRQIMMKKSETIFPHHESGMLLLALVAIMLILGIVGYTFVSIVSTERKATVVVYSSTKAFYINEGVSEIIKKYISDQNAVTPDWAPNTDLFVDEPMGEGTFWVNMTWPVADSTTITSEYTTQVP